MWIVMTKTYTGAVGPFARGCRYDLPERTVALLTDKGGKKCWKRSCAPWEDHVDQKAVRAAQARAGYEIARARAIKLAAEADDLKQKADAYVISARAAQAVSRKAEKEAVAAKTAAGKKGASDNARKKALGLARESEKAAAMFQIAHSGLTTLLAQSELKRLEAEDAKRESNKLAAQLGIEEEAEPAENESKADDQPEGPPVPPAEQSGDVQDEVKET